MIINIGNSDVKKYTLTVNTNANAEVNVVKDGTSYSETANSNGKALFQLIAGTWTVTATFGGSSKTATVEVETDTSVDLYVSMIPSFTYSGTYKIVDDRDQEITMSTDNWKIKFLTGGTLKFTELNGAANGIDVFAVGGGGGGGGGVCNYGADNQGGGGGGGGKTSTKSGVTVDTNSAGYEIRIGTGGSGNGWGASGGNGGQTSGFGCTASGGTGGSAGNVSNTNGASGGTGTGAGGTSGYYVYDGQNGANGVRDFNNTLTSTYYGAGGGGGCGSSWYEASGLRVTNAGSGGRTGGGNGGKTSKGGDGQTNTGAGGGGGASNDGSSNNSIYNGGKGGSGILIIRNAR